MWKNMKKENRHMVVTSLVVMLVLISFGILFVQSNRKLLIDEIQEFLVMISRQEAAAINGRLKSKLETLESLANLNMIKMSAVDKNTKLKILEEEVSRSSFIRIGVGDIKGNTVTTDKKGFYIGDRDYFKEAMQGNSSISGSLEDKTNIANKIVVYGVPIIFGNQVEGILFATEAVESLKEVIREVYYKQEKAKIFIVDKEGHFIIGDEEGNIQEKYNRYAENAIQISKKCHEEIAINLKEGKCGIGNYVDEGKQKYLAYAPIEDSAGWSVMVSLSEDVVLHTSNQVVLRTSILVVAMLIVLAGAMGYIDNILKKYKKAEIANKAKSDFLSKMSHEIRTPMNAIIGMTHIAISSVKKPEKVLDCLKKIDTSSKHLLHLINDILDMSKIEAGKLDINCEKFDFNKLIQDVTTLTYPKITEKNQNFEVILRGVEEEILIGDSLRIEQVLLNFLSNAVKFTPSYGNIRFEIKQLEAKEKKVNIQFRVIDTGMGMSKEFMGRMFTAFEQQDNTITRQFGGTGLGLSIAKLLIDRMEGKLEIASEIGKGSTFSFNLWLDVPEKESLEEAKYSFGDLKILIVDDDKDMCEYLNKILKKMGIQPEIVNSGSEGIQKIKDMQDTQQFFDICLIDWQMPEIDGIEAARQMKQYMKKECFIILMSACDISIMEEVKAEGINKFISKPIFPSTLYDMIVEITQVDKEVKVEQGIKEEYSFSNKRVLLVEDNEINRIIGIEVLEQLGLTVEYVEDGKQAVEQFEQSVGNYYDAILMDIQMPVMDGYTATERIRKGAHPRARVVPIIAMTANAFSEDVAEAIGRGMNGHIAKPIDIKTLGSTLSSYF